MHETTTPATMSRREAYVRRLALLDPKERPVT
jgi:hypothetical protein